ncbi:MRN complex-interacting protein isoform X1 [Lemur catta]|uniref:MRN complex-interacting protein isoform X1 n=1 Tax=Lemur catta TaxID=9447 RepID=UPI001E26DE7E|nr:MRN complex-interacting protein isoform X1 [Lemur catta]
MAPPQRARVLRCCSCRLFQAHQVKKSVKWTCKACGKQQSFLQAYGEGSGADCRRHVQKLNLLQGQVSELSLRSLEGPVGASEEETVGHRQAENLSLQEKPQPSESRWLKYLEKDSQEPELEGACFHRQPLSKTEPDCPFSQDLPRKRKWSQSTVQPPRSLDVQGLGDSQVTLEPQGYAGLIGEVEQDSHCRQHSVGCSASEPGARPWELRSPAQHVKTTPPEWARFLLSPGDSSHVDTEPQRPRQRGPSPAGPAQVEQGTRRAQTPREGHLRSLTTTVQPPGATHAPTSGSERPCRKAPGQLWGMGTPRAESGSLVQEAQKPPPLRLCDLFATGEDFDDL